METITKSKKESSALIYNVQNLSFQHNTPFAQLDLPASYAKVYVKLEKYNMGGSIKAKAAEMMIKQAEKDNLLKPFSGQTIVECSGGNMGLGLTLIAAQRGYKVQLAIPDNYSITKREILKMLGADVCLSDHTQGNDSHFILARKLANETPDAYFISQLENPANVEAHYCYTGKEIVNAIGQIDCFVAGIGSGGTISGVGKRIKETFPKAKIIGIQPEGCDTLNGKAVEHKIHGIAIDMLPPILNKAIIDDMYTITFQEVMDCASHIAKTHGLFLGISSYANIATAIYFAKKLGKNKTIVTVAPDSGEAYIETYINYSINNN
ncbi:cysteine synthase [Bacteroidia bacterium]|nr:cysteine synthase [Bacteroidia bacterium]